MNQNNKFNRYSQFQQNDQSQNNDSGDYWFSYDTPEQIQKCLNCTKPECTNCLEYGGM